MASDIILPSTFRRRITVKTPVTLQDSGGGIETSGYEDLYTTWASVEEMSTGRKAYYGMDLFVVAWNIILRYNADRIFTTGTVIGYADMNLIVMDCRLLQQDYKRFYTMICVQSEIK